MLQAPMKRPWQRVAGLVQGATRWNEWSESKLPLLLTALFYQALLAHSAADQALEPAALLGRFGVILAVACLGLAFGYALNDFADRDVDRRAGKASLLGALGPLAGGALVVGLAVAGVASLWLFYGQPLVIELGLLCYLVGAAYSLPPLRLKERGFLGLVVGAAAQGSVPALAIFAVFDDLGWEAALFGCLFLLVGLRWMLVHQLIDLGADRETGVRTYVADQGRERALWQLRRLVFPLEVACLGAVLVVMVGRLPAFGLLLLPYALYVGARILLAGGIRAAFSLEGYDRQPLADFYLVFWPLSLSVLLAIGQPWLFPVALMLVVWQRRPLARGMATLKRLIRVKLSPTRERTNTPLL
jgi:4-hydroxybenzoate polyprenyltransferase